MDDPAAGLSRRTAEASDPEAKAGRGDGDVFHQHKAAAIVALPVAPPADRWAAALQSKLAPWGRSPDVYAVILHLTGGGTATPGAPGAASAPAGGMTAVAQILSLVWHLECLPKPLVVLIDGPVTGGTIGLTAFGTHRVATEAYRLQMPLNPANAALGVPPLGGIAHRLARLSRERGAEWALGARTIGRAEAYAAGLVTHCVAQSALPGVIAALADGQPVDPLLDDLHRDPALDGTGPDGTGPDAAALRRCFATPSTEQAREALARENSGHAPWAHAALAALAATSPLALAAAHRLIETSRALDIRDSLILTYRLADGLARTDPAMPVSAASLDALFQLPASGDLPLTPRRDVANLRF